MLREGAFSGETPVAKITLVLAVDGGVEMVCKSLCVDEFFFAVVAVVARLEVVVEGDLVIEVFVAVITGIVAILVLGRVEVAVKSLFVDEIAVA